MTEREIDEFKDNMEMDDENFQRFVEMVKHYKVEHPTHTKCVQRWRNWYKKMSLCSVPAEELAILEYHLESFNVYADKEKAAMKLTNWLHRMTNNGYEINWKLEKKINARINKYGYKIK